MRLLRLFTSISNLRLGFSVWRGEASFSSKGAPIAGTDLIRVYFQQGMIRDAQAVFAGISNHDTFTCSIMIAGYVSCQRYFDAWHQFCNLPRYGVIPNSFTISSTLKACTGMRSLSFGSSVHGMAVKSGLEKWMYVENALLDLYAKCCVDMNDAVMAFAQIEVKIEVSWTTLIAGYAHRGDSFSALLTFQQMLSKSEEAKMSPFIFSIAARICASTGSHYLGKQIHLQIIKNGLIYDIPVMNSILDMYCKLCCLDEAGLCFNIMSERDVVTWNTIVAGYEKPDPVYCLHIFSQMESQGFTPNFFTFTTVLAASSNLALLRCGQQVHASVSHRGLGSDQKLCNALIDMYAKCGSISDSRKVFAHMNFHDLLSWTSMMTGYGAHGFGEEAVKLFDEMVESGIKPDKIVFMGLLTACSHSGLVGVGLDYFASMKDHGVVPDQEILGCAVDLLGRAGRAEEAYELTKEMSFTSNSSPAWGSLIGVCRNHLPMNFREMVSHKMLESGLNTPGMYVSLSNMYASDKRWGDFARMRKMVRGMERKKEAGRSWVEVGNEVCSFVVGDKAAPHIECVYGILNIMYQHIMRVPCTYGVSDTNFVCREEGRL